MVFDVLVEVRLRAGIADPQGATIERACPPSASTACAACGSARHPLLASTPPTRPTARAEVDDLCHRFLTNPVIEDATSCQRASAPADDVGGRAVPRHQLRAGRRRGHRPPRRRGRHRVARRPPAAERVDAVVVPGGFAHGDYLRTGAIARFSPVMAAVAEFAAAGGPVVGICNGFQIL